MKTPENTERLRARLQLVADDADLYMNGTQPENYEPIVVLAEEVDALPDNLYSLALATMAEADGDEMLDSCNNGLYDVLTNLKTFK